MTKHSFREYMSDDLKQSSPIRELKEVLEVFLTTDGKHCSLGG